MTEQPPRAARRRRRFAAASVALPVLALVAADRAGAASPSQQTVQYRLPAGRTYQLLPGADRPGAARPLIVMLHGASRSVADTAGMTGLTRWAEAHDVVLAYGQGVGGRWNAGGCCGAAAATGVDDIGYLRALVAHAASVTAVDPTRVYVVGWSNGGMLAHRAACEAGDVFAAAAVVSSALLAACPAPAAVIHLHGLADTTVPTHGGRGYAGLDYPPSWSEPLRMPAGSSWTYYPSTGGHAWDLVSPGNPDATNDLLWSFLGRHRLD